MPDIQIQKNSRHAHRFPAFEGLSCLENETEEDGVATYSMRLSWGNKMRYRKYQ